MANNNRYRYFNTIWNEDFSHSQKGLLNKTFKEDLKGLSYSLYIIPLKYRYRPDLISLNFYGDHRLYWVLIYVNHFNNSPFDFEEGAVIKIPSFSELVSLL